MPALCAISPPCNFKKWSRGESVTIDLWKENWNPETSSVQVTCFWFMGGTETLTVHFWNTRFNERIRRRTSVNGSEHLTTTNKQKLRIQNKLHEPRLTVLNGCPWELVVSVVLLTEKYCEVRRQQSHSHFSQTDRIIQTKPNTTVNSPVVRRKRWATNIS